jgi:hypothetical protein
MDRSDLVSTDQTVSAAITGDEPAFAALTERHRRELHVHCYRMLASFDNIPVTMPPLPAFGLKPTL